MEKNKPTVYFASQALGKNAEGRITGNIFEILAEATKELKKVGKEVDLLHEVEKAAAELTNDGTRRDRQISGYQIALNTIGKYVNLVDVDGVEGVTNETGDDKAAKRRSKNSSKK